MSTVTISEEEFLRLKEKAGETIVHEVNSENCRRHGHAWRFIGGANAGCCDTCCCSVPVHQCIVCGDNDYGENEEALEIRRLCEEGGE